MMIIINEIIGLICLVVAVFLHFKGNLLQAIYFLVFWVGFKVIATRLELLDELNKLKK